MAVTARTHASRSAYGLVWPRSGGHGQQPAGRALRRSWDATHRQRWVAVPLRILRKPAAERKTVLLRLKAAIYHALARWANDELRGTNAEMEYLLRRALAEDPRLRENVGVMRRRGRPPHAAA